MRCGYDCVTHRYEIHARKFTGKIRDTETGLDDFGSRYMSSAQGRFTGADHGSKGIVPANPQTWNKYTYAANNPLAYVDINGEWPFYVHNEMLDLAFGRVLPGNELKQLKLINWNMDFGDGAQDPGRANLHSMCTPKQDVGGCLGGIESSLSTDMKLASESDRSLALGFVGSALHTIADWSSPAHVNDSGIPYTWTDPPRYSADFRAHFSGESAVDVNPTRFYLGVRLMVALYLTRFPEEKSKFANLDSWILQDARIRAYNPYASSSQNPADYLRARVEADNKSERLAQCWAGNPAACDD